MNVLIVAGRLPGPPWTITGTLRLIARGLAARGHEVAIACQGVDDPQSLAPSPVIALAPYEQNGSDWPRGLGHWARRVAVRGGFDAVLSLSRCVRGDLWMPLGPTPGAWMSGVLEAHGPIGLAKALYRHAGVLAAARAGERPGRIAVIGKASRDAARSALAAQRLDTRVVALPFFSSLRAPDPLTRERWRAKLRSAIGVREADTLALVSSVGHVGDSLANVLAALPRINGTTARGGSCIALVLARDIYHAHDQAVRAGCTEWVRILGPTSRIAAALAACDVALVPEPAPVGADAFSRGDSGRFAADALRMARPVLAEPFAPGAELVRAQPPLGDPGSIVRSDGVEPVATAWARAIGKAMDPAWRDRATLAAAAAGEQLGENGFHDAIEECLHAAIGERPRAPGPRRDGARIKG
ncbi:MAG: hypothetical protein KF869_09045 [Phycisphaeraceae bacterium]|nr:hypothetical protein [Phycisphaeraceae bacterium]